MQFPFITLGVADIFQKVINDISSGFSDELHPDLFTFYQQNYHKAIKGVLGEPKFASQYFEIAQKFNLNTAKLAAYKSHYATGLLQKLYKEDPNKFKKYSTAILKTFNRWQATEYNTTVARARSAKQYIEFEAERELYPNIEWLATRSSTPRELHASFVGTVLPQDDPFWQENQPGNLYNCKCDWRTTDKKVTGMPPSAGKVKPDRGLEGNPAITGEIFSEKHSYFDKATQPEVVNIFIKKQIIKPAVTRVIQNIEPYEGLKVVSNSLKTGQMIVTRKSVKEIVKHNSDIAVQIEAMFLNHNVKNWEYLGYSVAEAKHKEAAYFFYYSTVFNNKTRYVNVMIHKHFKSEIPYAILNKINIDLLKEGVPNDIDIYIYKNRS